MRLEEVEASVAEARKNLEGILAEFREFFLTTSDFRKKKIEF